MSQVTKKSEKMTTPSARCCFYEGLLICMRLKTGPLRFCFFQNLLKPIAAIEEPYLII